MSVKSRIGFGGRRIDSDDLIATVGTGSILLYTSSGTPNAETTWYATASAPLGAGVYKLWEQGAITSASEFWMFGNVQVGSNNGSNDGVQLGWGNGGVKLGYMRLEDFTNRYQLVIDGVAVETSTSAISLSVWDGWAIKVTLVNGPTGRVEFYTKGNLSFPLLTWDGNTDPTGAGSANATHINWARRNEGWANIVVMDPNDATGLVDPNRLSNYGIETKYPTGDGFYAVWIPDSGLTGWTQIAPAPPVDTSYIRSNGVGQRSSFTFAMTTAATVLSVSAIFRDLRAGIDAGLNVSVFRRNSAVDYDDAAQPAPGIGNVCGAWDDAPGGGNWTPTIQFATEFGQLSVT